MRLKTFKIIAIAIALLGIASGAMAINLDDGFDKGKLPANQITTDTSNFSKNLSSQDSDVQRALNTLDQLTAGIPEAPIDGSTYGRKNATWIVVGGGSQTPWTSDIDGAGYNLSNVGTLDAHNIIAKTLQTPIVVNVDGSPDVSGTYTQTTQIHNYSPVFTNGTYYPVFTNGTYFLYLYGGSSWVINATVTEAPTDYFARPLDYTGVEISGTYTGQGSYTGTCTISNLTSATLGDADIYSTGIIQSYGSIIVGPQNVLNDTAPAQLVFGNWQDASATDFFPMFLFNNISQYFGIGQMDASSSRVRMGGVPDIGVPFSTELGGITSEIVIDGILTIGQVPEYTSGTSLQVKGPFATDYYSDLPLIYSSGSGDFTAGSSLNVYYSGLGEHYGINYYKGNPTYPNGSPNYITYHDEPTAGYEQYYFVDNVNVSTPLAVFSDANGGRVIINNHATDDMVSALQVNGNIRATGAIVDNSGSFLTSIDPNNRILYASDGTTPMMDWSNTNYSLYIGSGAYSVGYGSTALGHGASSGGDYSNALGYYASSRGNYSNALGCGVSSAGDYSNALGYGASASTNYSTTIGSFNNTFDNPITNSMVLGGYNGSSDEAWLRLGTGGIYDLVSTPLLSIDPNARILYGRDGILQSMAWDDPTTGVTIKSADADTDTHGASVNLSLASNSGGQYGGSGLFTGGQIYNAGDDVTVYGGSFGAGGANYDTGNKFGGEFFLAGGDAGAYLGAILHVSGGDLIGGLNGSVSLNTNITNYNDGTVSFDFNNRWAIGVDGTSTVLNYGQLDVIDGVTARAILPHGIMDTSDYLSIDPNLRQLWGSDGTTLMEDWSTPANGTVFNPNGTFKAALGNEGYYAAQFTYGAPPFTTQATFITGGYAGYFTSSGGMDYVELCVPSSAAPEYQVYVSAGADGTYGGTAWYSTQKGGGWYNNQWIGYTDGANFFDGFYGDFNNGGGIDSIVQLNMYRPNDPVTSAAGRFHADVGYSYDAYLGSPNGAGYFTDNGTYNVYIVQTNASAAIQASNANTSIILINDMAGLGASFDNFTMSRHAYFLGNDPVMPATQVAASFFDGAYYAKFADGTQAGYFTDSTRTVSLASSVFGSSDYAVSATNSGYTGNLGDNWNGAAGYFTDPAGNAASICDNGHAGLFIGVNSYFPALVAEQGSNQANFGFSSYAGYFTDGSGHNVQIIDSAAQDFVAYFTGNGGSDWIKICRPANASGSSIPETGIDVSQPYDNTYGGTAWHSHNEGFSGANDQWVGHLDAGWYNPNGWKSATTIGSTTYTAMLSGRDEGPGVEYAGAFYDGTNSTYLADGTYAINARGDQVFQSGTIVDLANSVTTIDTNNRYLQAPYTAGNAIVLDWAGLELYDNGSYLSLDWGERTLYSNTQSPMLYWSNDGTLDAGTNAVKATAFDLADGSDKNYTLSVYASGSNAVITDTDGLATFGTQSPTLTIDKAGTYSIRARVNQFRNNASHIIAHTITYHLRRTNNTAADITGSSTSYVDEAHASSTETEGIFNLPEVIYTTANTDDVIELWVVIDSSTTSGTHEVAEANIIAQRISG